MDARPPPVPTATRPAPRPTPQPSITSPTTRGSLQSVPARENLRGMAARMGTGSREVAQASSEHLAQGRQTRSSTRNGKTQDKVGK